MSLRSRPPPVRLESLKAQLRRLMASEENTDAGTSCHLDHMIYYWIEVVCSWCCSLWHCVIVGMGEWDGPASACVCVFGR